MRTIVALFMVLILMACTSVAERSGPAKQAGNSTAVENIPLEKRVYFLQHKLLPKWTFETNGGFYQDLINGDLERLRMAAAEIVNENYAHHIRLTTLAKESGFFLEFPRPEEIGACFYVYIAKSEKGYVYMTYEKTLDLAKDGVVGVVGAWSEEGRHQNYGARKYEDLDSFLADVLKIHAQE